MNLAPFDVFAELAGTFIDNGVDPAVIVEALAKVTVATHVSHFMDPDYKNTLRTLLDDCVDAHLKHVNQRN